MPLSRIFITRKGTISSLITLIVIVFVLPVIYYISPYLSVSAKKKRTFSLAVLLDYVVTDLAKRPNG